MPKKNDKTLMAERKFFTDKKAAELPDLIQVQKSSYEWFVKEGLRELFEDISPIEPFNSETFELSFWIII